MNCEPCEPSLLVLPPALVRPWLAALAGEGPAGVGGSTCREGCRAAGSRVCARRKGIPSAAMVTVAAPSVFGPKSSGCRDRWRGAARVQARCREAAWREGGGREGCLDGRWWAAWEEACGEPEVGDRVDDGRKV